MLAAATDTERCAAKHHHRKKSAQASDQRCQIKTRVNTVRGQKRGQSLAVLGIYSAATALARDTPGWGAVATCSPCAQPRAGAGREARNSTVVPQAAGRCRRRPARAEAARTARRARADNGGPPDTVRPRGARARDRRRRATSAVESRATRGARAAAAAACRTHEPRGDEARLRERCTARAI